MADPLGFINGAGSGAAGRVNGPGMIRPPAGGSIAEPNQTGFKDVLLENLRQVNALQQDADKAVEDLVTGKRDDMEGVILATQKADSAFRMLQAVRNRVMEAYDELKQVRI